jgi:hypothetical protein
MISGYQEDASARRLEQTAARMAAARTTAARTTAARMAAALAGPISRTPVNLGKEMPRGWSFGYLR